jgi:hypothetical protein
MKYTIITCIVFLSACSTYDKELQAHLKAEQDFHAHQSYIEDLYSKYDAEYIDDCLHLEELICEFE